MNLDQIIIAIDQLINTFFNGMADETISARAWRMEYENKPWGKILRPIIDTVLFFDKDHCYTSYLSEMERKQLPPEYEIKKA